MRSVHPRSPQAAPTRPGEPSRRDGLRRREPGRRQRQPLRAVAAEVDLCPCVGAAAFEGEDDACTELGVEQALADAQRSAVPSPADAVRLCVPATAGPPPGLRLGSDRPLRCMEFRAANVGSGSSHVEQPNALPATKESANQASLGVRRVARAGGHRPLRSAGQPTSQVVQARSSMDRTLRSPVHCHPYPIPLPSMRMVI
jgi:hypothetical protein